MLVGRGMVEPPQAPNQNTMTKTEVNAVLTLTEKVIKELEAKGIPAKDAVKFKQTLLFNQKLLTDTDLGSRIDRVRT